jgi:antirestriction protein ArdC
MPTQNEIRSRINDQILAALSDPTKLPPWRQPWNCSDANVGPSCNIVSQRRYTGVNPLLLEIAAHRHALQSKWWGTFRQWEALGGRVNRRPDNVPPGQWGTQIVFCRPVTKTQIRDNGEEFEDKFFVLRTYTVFNLEQVSGPFDKLRVGNAPLPVHEIEQRCEQAEAVMAATGADIRYGGNKACYSIAGDYIQMPHRQQFALPEFYETAFHELTHWTEHAKRLNWDRDKEGYAMGELIAELGGCYMAAELGLPTSQNLENHVAYLRSWLSGMQNDARFIFKAAAQANRAVDYLLSFSGQSKPEPEAEEALVG